MLGSLRCLTVGSRHKQTLLSFISLHTSTSTSTSTTTSFSPKFKSPIHESIHLLLEKCTHMRELKQLHAQIILQGLTQQTLTLGKLVSFCAVAESGDLQYAQVVFDEIPEPNRYMYNSLIRGYSNSDDPLKAIRLYHQMISSGLSPNEFTFPFVLKVCAFKSAYLDAVLVHGHAIKLGFVSQVCVQNALINVFVVCGLIHCARKVFADIGDRTLVSWNSMIGGYSKMGCCKEAFLLFREMRELGVVPDEFTFVNLLSVCSQTCDLESGRYVHSYIEVTGSKTDIYVQNALVDMYAKCGHLHTAQAFFDRMLDKNVVSWTSMVSAYAKHGLIDFAQKFFEQMPVKNVVSWNSMISCYVQEGRCREALDLFGEMCNSRVVPDETTLVSVLSSCSQLGDLVMGKRTHNYICSNNITPSITLSNALVDMYAKCGPVQIALDIFLEMPEKNVVSWNVMIRALALHGCGFKAIQLFEKMQGSGIWPDEITFMGMLCACSHSGLVDIGRYYFDRMGLIYGIPYEIEHYACMVDLLGRGGHLEEAIKLIGGMPMKPDVVVWGALLGACRTHGNFMVGKQILKQLLELEPHSGGLYVLLSNIYCEARRWDDVKKIRKLMKDHRIKKGNAISSIEIDGSFHEFMVDDKRRDATSGIYSMLDQLTDHLKSEGYLCKLSSAFLDAEEM
ncbi:pentatricopeptide repeat-containing protein At2g22410, mitochondrial-like [Cornus florida]|uniref:pentatricopeptide repeat-containing protein At2g22410, mitochondrial-like n=1 Tax=Cornus florida TaxID=4283 RepID=UPI0028A2C90E|nr:pentatricopeptide repeat-containing protein At2g22410, mitochondrial-like [Cornus florida]